MAILQVNMTDPYVSQVYEIGFSQVIISESDSLIIPDPASVLLLYQGHFLPGDVNQVNTIDVLDIVMTVSYIMGSIKLIDYQILAADINDDNFVDVLDIVIIVQTIIS